MGVALVQEHAVPFVPRLCASLQSLLRSPLCSAKKHVLPSKIGTRPAPISAAPSPAHQDTHLSAFAPVVQRADVAGEKTPTSALGSEIDGTRCA